MKPQWIPVQDIVCWALEDGRPYAEAAMLEQGYTPSDFHDVRYALTIDPRTGALVLAAQDTPASRWYLSMFQPNAVLLMNGWSLEAATSSQRRP